MGCSAIPWPGRATPELAGDIASEFVCVDAVDFQGQGADVALGGRDRNWKLFGKCCDIRESQPGHAR